MVNSSAPLLQLVEITHTFPGVKALDGVSLDLRGGEVHALVGENGAGKSTLINIISGVLQPDHGKLLFDGQPVAITDPVTARRSGIVTVHQEAELFPTLSVAENMALTQGLPTRGSGFVDWRAVNSAARDAVSQIGEDIDVRMPAARLSVAHRHMTQVAAALLQAAKVVILDEPTSALSEVESQWLFAKIARLKTAGAGIIYISHRQEEIFALADRITVLRDGRRVWTGERDTIDRDGLIQAMVGRREDVTSHTSQVKDPNSTSRYREQSLLRVRQLNDPRGRFRDIDFDAWAGEIVGVYGLVGSGRTEFAHGLFGIAKTDRGSIEVGGNRCAIRRPKDAIRTGISYVPEDRLRQGLCRGLSIRANMVLSSLHRWARGPIADASAERRETREMTRRLAIHHRAIEQPIGQLSGGNQQKVVLGRWLLTEPKVLILDEPTRGVDVGVKAEIHRLLRGLADEGRAVVMISSELTEVTEHADRIVVFREGTIAGQFDPRNTTAGQIAEAALPKDTPPADRAGGDRDVARTRWNLPRGEFGLLAIVVALTFWLGFTSNGFFSANNLGELLANTSIWTILGLAAAIVILAGGIDISIGSLLALAAVSAGIVLKLPMQASVTVPLAVLVACLVGTAGGLVNGAVSLLGRVHPIVVTLGMMIVYRGTVIALRSANEIHTLPKSFGWLAIHPPSGFHGSIVFGVLVAIAAHVWLRHTPSGRNLFALGASPTAARLVGISRIRTSLLSFSIGGLLAGIAAIVVLARSDQMQATLGTGWELQAIAVAVIGGASITGGRGTVFGVGLGALFLQLVKAALVRWQIPGDRVDVVVGGMLLAAVLFDLVWRKRDV